MTRSTARPAIVTASAEELSYRRSRVNYAAPNAAAMTSTSTVRLNESFIRSNGRRQMQYPRPQLTDYPAAVPR